MEINRIINELKFPLSTENVNPEELGEKLLRIFQPGSELIKIKIPFDSSITKVVGQYMQECNNLRMGNIGHDVPILLWDTLTPDEQTETKFIYLGFVKTCEFLTDRQGGNWLDITDISGTRRLFGLRDSISLTSLDTSGS